MDDADRADGGGVRVPLSELETDGQLVAAGGTCRWRGQVVTVDYVVRDASDPGRSFASVRVIGR